jgi:hypothetical protein
MPPVYRVFVRRVAICLQGVAHGWKGRLGALRGTILARPSPPCACPKAPEVRSAPARHCCRRRGEGMGIFLGRSPIIDLARSILPTMTAAPITWLKWRQMNEMCDYCRPLPPRSQNEHAIKRARESNQNGGRQSGSDCSKKEKIGLRRHHRTATRMAGGIGFTMHSVRDPQDFLDAELQRILAMFRGKDGRIDTVAVEAVLAVLDGSEPHEIEAMLVIQRATTHALASSATSPPEGGGSRLAMSDNPLQSMHAPGAKSPVSLHQCVARGDAACTEGRAAQAHEGARVMAITDTAGERLTHSRAVRVDGVSS